MAIPDFQTVMLPVLRDLAQGERTGQETLGALAAEFALTPEEIVQRLPSGTQGTFTNRVAWAKSHLKAQGSSSRLAVAFTASPTEGAPHSPRTHRGSG